MNNIETSIILPVYNVENYIEECIKSLVHQTYIDFEMIFVIDGSKDSSEKIVREWEQKDDRIKVITQKNSGSGPARNNGLSHASGAYIVFIDPDDWIEPEMLNVLINEIKTYDADMVTSGCCNDYYENGCLVRRTQDLFNFEFIDHIDTIHRKYIPLFLNGGMGAPTKKVYRKSIIDKYNIIFPDLKRSQDIVFNYRYFEYVNKLIIDDNVFYHYRVEELGYSKKVHNKYYEAVALIYSDIKNLLKKWNIEVDVEYEREFYRYFYNLIVWQISIGNSANEMKNIINDKNIRDLTRKVQPIDFKQFILKILILLRLEKLINLSVEILKVKK